MMTHAHMIPQGENNTTPLWLVKKYYQNVCNTCSLHVRLICNPSLHIQYNLESMETRWLSDSSELGNINQRGFVSGSVGFVGGIEGEPTAVKVFMMWQKFILRLRARSEPDVSPAVLFLYMHTCTRTSRQDAENTTYSSSVTSTHSVFSG